MATKYFLDGSTILAQQTGSEVLWFLYESDGTRVGFTYNGTAYYYTLNAQGDVTGIVDSNCNTVVQYSYDAWGKLLSTTGSMASTIGKLNSFLYRGYYYDSENGLYYLNSRCYDAITGRMINADRLETLTASPTSTTDKNLFSYCDNDPVNRTDDEGGFWHIIAGAVIGGVVSIASQVIANKMEGKALNNGLGIAFVTGAASGALAATGVGLLGQVAANVALGMGSYAIDKVSSGQEVSTLGLITYGTIGSITGTGVGKGGSYALKDAAKLMNKNVITSVSNGIKNGVKSAVKRYATSRPVQRVYTSIAKDIIPSFAKSVDASAPTSLIRRLYNQDKRMGWL